jgi:hypothetical protein
MRKGKMLTDIANRLGANSVEIGYMRFMDGWRIVARFYDGDDFKDWILFER